jgi:hypothetical protein
MALASAGTPRLIIDIRIKRARRVPENLEWPLTAGMVPNTRRHHTILACHPAHLAKAPNRVCHEVDYELSQGGVEGLIGEWELFGRSASHIDFGVPLMCRGYEGF